MSIPQCPLSMLTALMAGSLAATTAVALAQNDATIPRPEHPDPQRMRAEWLSLNGPWEFAETDNDADESFLDAPTYPDKINVPFCRESKLSGLGRGGFIKNVWYRRSVEVPKDWRSPRVLLHVGACDWTARVWVNGQRVVRHTGGSAGFAVDVTAALRPGGPNTIIIHARDDTRSGKQALGKQSTREESQGIFYTRTTGIWQTVWLEGVGESFIRDHWVTPDAGHAGVLLAVDVRGSWEGLTLAATALMNDQPVGTVSAAATGSHNQLVLNLSTTHRWSAADPFLYDLTLTLSRGGRVVDRLDSYFGLRSVAIEGAALLINGQPVFQRLVLDQGFYPAGVWTAPSDFDLRRDIVMSQEAGFNGARLHQKVFEPRFLYWADKLGYLVWGEFPSFGASYGDPAVNVPIIDEWVEIVERDRNHPSIIGWCPFNETPSEAGPLQNAMLRLTRAIDPTRPAIDSSGWFHSSPDPELSDAHDYDQNPESFRDRWMHYFGDLELPARYGPGGRAIPFFISEYGGIGWDIGQGWGYGNAPKSPEEFYARHAGLTGALLDNPRLFGFCYTQLTDVEQERNGLYTFDRKAKFDVARLRQVNARPAAYEKNPPLRIGAVPIRWWVLVGAFPDGQAARPWRYTGQTPTENWNQTGFDDRAWEQGRGGFGQKGKWSSRARSPWTTPDLWLRQPFDWDGSPFEVAALAILHDDGTEVYLNGQPILKLRRCGDDYNGFDLTRAVRSAIRPGNNLLAIHCRQSKKEQFADAALLIGVKKK